MRAVWLIAFVMCLSTSAAADPEPDATPDRDPQLTLGTRVYPRFRIRDRGQPDQVPHEFSMRRASLRAEWRPLSWLEAEADFDIANTPPIKDAEVRVEIDRWLRLHAGQFKKPFSRLRLTGPGRLPLISRGHGNSLIAEDLAYGDRDLGIMASGRLAWFRYAAGVFNGNGTAKEIDAGKDAAARIEIRPHRSIHLGASGSMKYRNPPGVTELPQKDVWAAGADARLRLGPARLVVEGLWAQERTLSMQRDKFALIGFFYLRLPPLEPIMKVEHVDFDLHGSGVHSTAMLLGMNVHVHDTLRVMVQGEQVLATAESLLAEERSVIFQLAFDYEIELYAEDE